MLLLLLLFCCCCCSSVGVQTNQSSKYRLLFSMLSVYAECKSESHYKGFVGDERCDYHSAVAFQMYMRKMKYAFRPLPHLVKWRSILTKARQNRRALTDVCEVDLDMQMSEPSALGRNTPSQLLLRRGSSKHVCFPC